MLLNHNPRLNPLHLYTLIAFPVHSNLSMMAQIWEPFTLIHLKTIGGFNSRVYVALNY